MQRRGFLRYSAGAAVPFGVPRFRSNLPHGDVFSDQFTYAIADSFKSDWGPEDLEKEFSDTVDFTCYAYGRATEMAAKESRWEPGFLSKIRNIEWEKLAQNPEVYDWALELVNDLAGFLSYVDVIPDWVGEKLEENRFRIRGITELLPVLWCLKGVLETGCSIHDTLRAGKKVAEETYLRFFKFVALVAVEVFLLMTGSGIAYKTAFKATGGVNQLLINRIGRKIGWKAYSWVLSQLHWGIRVVFTEGFGKAVDGATEATVQNVLYLVEALELSVSESIVRSHVRGDVESMAEKTSSWYNTDYLIWSFKNSDFW